MREIEFRYLTALRSAPYESATLMGSWDAEGKLSTQFSSVPMESIETADRCPGYRARVRFPDGEIGNTFRWGVLLRMAGHDVWGIAEEVNDHNSRENVRVFQLEANGANPIQSYRLNWSRHLGAQKIYLPGDHEPRIQFAVWAPAAQEIDVLMGDFREKGAPDSAIDPTRPPASPPGLSSAMRPIEAAQVAGGYIQDDGTGAHASWGPFRMTKDASSGIWFTDPQDPALANFAKFDHCPYLYRIKRDDGKVVCRTDLYSRCQAGFGTIRPEKEPQRWQESGLTRELDGSVSCSVVKDPDEVCRDRNEEVYPEQNWVTPGTFWDAPPQPGSRPIRTQVQDLVIYELHVGALGFNKPGDQAGTLEDAIDFLDHLVDLGVNAVELLPMAEFGGNGSGWGYATSHYFAIEYAGGGRDKYKHFIRECHRRGIAVILDVVFNHYSHEADRAEWMYDSTAHEKNIYYWYEGHPGDYPAFDAAVDAGQKGQGGYVDNLSTAWAPRYREPMVRRMFVSSLLALVSEFKVDGFRFDQTTSIHAYNQLHANGTPVGEANIFGRKLLCEATRALRLVKPDVMIMAEDHSNWDLVTRPNDEGGMGFDAAWYADFYHHLIGDTDKGPDYAKLLKTAGLGDNRPLALDSFASALAASGGRRVVYHESHDEAGNGSLTDRTINVAVNGAPLVGKTRRVAEARVRLVAGITLLSAGVPMFLFGEEVGAQQKFLYNHVLDNRENYLRLRKEEGANLFTYYSALIRLRLDESRPGLRSPQIEVVHVHNSDRLLVFRRWHEGQNFLVIANFSDAPYASPSYVIRSSLLGDERWREIFNSDAPMFGGNGVGNFGDVRGFSGGIDCTIPARGLLVFERI